MQEIEGRHIHVDNISGPVLLAVVKEQDAIPPEKARDCPQCGEKAWAESRFCWSCRWDFDAATIQRFHPTKLLAISIVLNIVSAALLLVLSALSFMR